MANPVEISFAKSDTGGSANLYGSVTASYARVGSTVKITVVIKVTSGKGKYWGLSFNGESILHEQTGTVTRTFSYDDATAKTYSYPVSVYIQTATSYAGYSQSYSLTIDVPAVPTGPGVPSQVYISNGWKDITGLYVKVSGSWKKTNGIYLKVAGAWKKTISKATITIYGAAKETIIYSGPESGTLTLNSSGSITKEVLTGSYSFKAGLTGRTATANVTANTSVYLRPTNFIYWYGVENVAFGGILCNDHDPKVTRNTNNISISVYRHGSGVEYRSFFTNSKVNLTNFSSLKGTLELMAVNGWYQLGIGSERNTYEPTTAVIGPSSKSTVSINISSISGSYYVGLAGTSYGKKGTVQAKIHAIWME